MQSPKAGACLECSWISKDANIVGAEWIEEKVAENEVRIVKGGGYRYSRALTASVKVLTFALSENGELIQNYEQRNDYFFF